MQAPPPGNERHRLAALRALNLLDTPPEERFDRITRVAQHTFGVPIALISLVDAERQWCKSSRGLAPGEVPRGASICAHALDGAGPLVIPDATRDRRVADNPLVTGPFHLRSYAGHPLRSPEGYTYGTLCLIDTAPRAWSPPELAILADLAAWAETELRGEQTGQVLAARRESETHLRAVMDNVGDGLLVFDGAGIVESLNPAAARMFAREEAEVVGGSIWALVPPSYPDEPLAGLARLVPGDPADPRGGAGANAGFRRERHCLRGDGRRFPAELTVTAIPTVGGARFVASVRDISERLEAEQALRAAHDALARQYREAEQARGQVRAVLDATGEGIALVAPDRRFLTVNRRFSEFFTIPDAEIIDRRFSEFDPLVDRVFADPGGLRELVAGTADDETRQFTAIVAQRWPQERDLQIYATPVHSADGAFLGRLYVFRDITREREIDRMKAEFISHVSHELRTPLTSIKGFVDLLADGAAGEINAEQREFLAIVSHSTDRLVVMINDILDISRIDAGRVHLRRVPLDIGRLIRAVAAALDGQIAAKGQRLIIDLPADLPPVAADADRVTEILGRLLSNAHKYTPRGGTLRFTATREGDAVRIAIHDSGIGISPAEQAQVFARFFRARNRATDETPGTGLGLSITRSLVELHGGEMALTSAPGRGSTFSFTLPLVPRTGSLAGARR